jgi:phosphoenolpyruvate carboxylase
MDRLARESRLVYERLLRLDGFLTFFGYATPIDAIEQSLIGSRPARRSGQRSLEDLRAIPWVFAWNQARFVLPGWYGLGAACSKLRAEDPGLLDDLVRAKDIRHRWEPFHYMISNAATAWATSSPEIMQDYSALVADDAIRSRVLDAILAEHARTGEALELIYGAPVGEARPRIQRMLDLRHSALIPLHRHQVDLLARWRETRENGQQAAERDLLPRVLLTVNAIAAGLGTTG